MGCPDFKIGDTVRLRQPTCAGPGPLDGVDGKVVQVFPEEKRIGVEIDPDFGGMVVQIAMARVEKQNKMTVAQLREMLDKADAEPEMPIRLMIGDYDFYPDADRVEIKKRNNEVVLVITEPVE